MRCLDDISNMIPEGTYLEMCDNLKQMHDKIPKNDAFQHISNNQYDCLICKTLENFESTTRALYHQNF